MEAQSYTAQERRAANQVWAAAGAYGFEPLFLAHNTDGTVDFYMNTIVGLVHKYYGDKLINSIFDRWAGDLRQAMLDDLAWLYLENAAYRLELPHRPVLEALRYSHADYFFAIQYKLSRQEWMARNQLVYTMQAARWRSVLGRNLPVMTPYESGLFRVLAPDTAPQPDQLQDALLAVYAKFDLFDGTVHPKAALHLHLDGLLATLATKALPTQMIKTDRVTVEHSNAVDAAGSGPSVDKRHHLKAKRRAGPRLHRELLWPLPLPAGAAAQGRTGAVHRGASGVPFVVQRGRAQPGTGPHPGGPASGRTGRAAGRPQPRLLRQKSGAAPQRGAAAHRADPQLHSGASAAQRAGGPQRQCGPRAGVARPAFER